MNWKICLFRLAGLLALFVPCVITDLRSRTVPVLYIGICAVLFAVLNLLLGWTPLIELLLGAVLGGVFIVVSVVSKGGIGTGDGILILSVGVWCGIWAVSAAALIGFLAAGLFGIGYMVVCRKGWKCQLPFAPFFAGATVGIQLLMQLVGT